MHNKQYIDKAEIFKDLINIAYKYKSMLLLMNYEETKHITESLKEVQSVIDRANLVL